MNCLRDSDRHPRWSLAAAAKLPRDSSPRRWSLGVAAVAIALTGALLGGAIGLPAGLVAWAGEPGIAAPAPDPADTPLATILLDANGEPFARLYDQYRVPVEVAEIAEEMKDAIIAIEDRRFFEHSGVDWVGVGRALLSNLFNSGSALDGQGASTITMQYVKNHRLYADADTPAERDAAVADTIERKLRDVGAALELEQRLGKEEILTRYLNTVYFGNGAYGIAAAARTYFDTTPAALTLPQAALLAGVVKAPATFDPVAAPDAARARRDLVLAAMTEVGSITRQQSEAATATGLGVFEPLRLVKDGCAAAAPNTGFFCRHVVQELGEHGLSPERLRVGGYTIRTTLDRDVTEAAARAAAEQLPVSGGGGIANAVAVVSPGRDQRRVLALVANREFGPDAAAGQSAYPLPSSPVPYGAGSIYKIFTAAAALEAGLDVRAELPAPERYTSTAFTDGGEPYTVTGDSGAPDEVTLTTALALSPNTTFVALLDRLGSVDPVVDMAYRLGMRRSLALPAGPDRTVGEAVRAEERASFTLGPVPVIPLELANVAATIVSGGSWCQPSAVVAVTDRAGQPVPLPKPPCERAIPERLADTLAAALSADSTIGTASAAADAAGWRRPMIGTTGTTQQHLSAGFIGATSHYAGAVMTWSDASPPRPVCAGDSPRLCSSGTLYGGTIPARTWFQAMTPLHKGLPVAESRQSAARDLTGSLTGRDEDREDERDNDDDRDNDRDNEGSDQDNDSDED